MSVAVLCMACAEPERLPLTAAELSDVRVQVEGAVRTFYAADTARNADAVVSLLWPDYEMLVDGNRLTFDQIAQGSREFMGSLALFNTVWSDLKVVPLSRDLALSSFIFRDSIVTLGGDLIQNRGPTTLIWERREGEWRMRFGDADHYPITR